MAGERLSGDWIAVTPRGAEVVTALRPWPLMAGWAWLGLILMRVLAGRSSESCRL
ncbi:MAG: hypothetical protein Q4G36_06090 [Paracoccus sp. (in: a-proteobacteria)]|nr:hypothetical protein [Paracoccus sp. (in: a-proteobacteria)]